MCNMVPDTVSPQCLKLLKKARQKPGNFDFKELCRLVECFGFEFAREKGSHRIYKSPGEPRLINLQPGKNGKAKPYQVKQVLKIIEERYGC